MQLQDAMEELLKQMEHQFVGIGCTELSRIQELMLRVQALRCLTAVDHLTDVGRTSSAFLALFNRVNE